MSKHTPGPWEFCGLNKRRWGVYPASAVNDGIDYFVAVTRQISNPEREKANARLIAAAPALLEALRFFASPPTSKPITWRKAQERARAAIAKAEGLEGRGEQVRSESEPVPSPAQTKGEG